MKKVLIAVGGVVVVAILVLFNLRASRGARTAVEVTKVQRRDVTKIVTASGTIRPKRRVNVSASAIGKVTKVAVKEGDVVHKGDFLLQIDPTPYRAAVEQLEAAVRGARASLDLEKAQLEKAQRDLKRSQELSKKEFVSEDELRNAQVTVDVAQARVKSAGESLAQQTASLAKARHDLEEVRITAEMSGVITALNVEQGESAIMGTINNPGTVLLTIADLSEMEAEVQVDETEVVYVHPGQAARVRLDAFPDTTFAGRVTEVGNSAIRSQLGLGQESVDFKVIVAILDSIPSIRPGLSASVDITVAEEHNALTVPIQCLTVRNQSTLKNYKKKEDVDSTSAPAGSSAAVAGENSGKGADIEGVMVVEDGVAKFRPVRVGIAGENYFVVDSGLEEGESVISGPFKAISDVADGDRVKIVTKD